MARKNHPTRKQQSRKTTLRNGTYRKPVTA